jgi:glucans biosynthesis protein
LHQQSKKNLKRRIDVPLKNPEGAGGWAQAVNATEAGNSKFREDRRRVLKTLAGSLFVASGASRYLAVPSFVCADSNNDRFGLPTLKNLAEKLARRAIAPPESLPNELRRLDYDRYRMIAFRHERALWREQALPFWVEFYHRGFYFAEKVAISLVEDGQAHPFPFDPALFQYRGELQDLKISNDLGFAGFRLLCRLPQRPHYQEFCSFLGASYFRAIATNQVYGASARGLAVNIGLPKPEEFPQFRAFWIEHPAKSARSIRAWALLDGPSVTGAYEFLVTPGLVETTLDVDCQLYFRQPVEKLGIAPQSSMWRWDEETQPDTDPRPHVHDSDGLLVASGNGEWLWRPLARREQPSVSQFQFDSLKGFGLMQRDRAADHYRDNEAKYHLRPSIWITPHEPWGPGAVELLELPTATEWADNVAAYWVPREAIRAGDSLTLRYRVAFTNSDPQQHRGGRVVQTRAERLPEHEVRFTVEFDSSVLRTRGADAPLQPVVTASAGKVAEVVCSRLPSGIWQLRFRLQRDEPKPSELRAFLREYDDVLSETWSYLCTSR